MIRDIDPSGLNPTITFADTRIPVVWVEDQPRIIMKYVFTDLGLEYSSALKNLKSKPWADLQLRQAHAVGGQLIRMQTATPDTFLQWLTFVVRVTNAHNPRLNQYQAHIRQILHQYATDNFSKTQNNQLERKLP